MLKIKRYLKPTQPGFKQISFAYPTSENAKEMKCYNDGCFTVDLHYPKYVIHVGPFSDVRSAEGFGEQFEFPWNPDYLRFPKPGSKFKKLVEH